MIARRHAKFHRDARGRHRQIERVLKLDLLRLCETERPRDVGERLAREHDRAGPDGAHRPDEIDLLDGLREQPQPAAILFEKPHARAIQVRLNE